MIDIRDAILKKMKKDGLTKNQVANLPKVKRYIPRRTVYAYLSGEKDSASKTVSILLDAVGLTITTTRGPNGPERSRGND
jgi:hypothetical protein